MPDIDLITVDLTENDLDLLRKALLNHKSLMMQDSDTDRARRNVARINDLLNRLHEAV